MASTTQICLGHDSHLRTAVRKSPRNCRLAHCIPNINTASTPRRLEPRRPESLPRPGLGKNSHRLQDRRGPSARPTPHRQHASPSTSSPQIPTPTRPAFRHRPRLRHHPSRPFARPTKPLSERSFFLPVTIMARSFRPIAPATPTSTCTAMTASFQPPAAWYEPNCCRISQVGHIKSTRRPRQKKRCVDSCSVLIDIRCSSLRSRSSLFVRSIIFRRT
jgi:hypothetical protein